VQQQRPTAFRQTGIAAKLHLGPHQRLDRIELEAEVDDQAARGGHAYLDIVGFEVVNANVDVD
jgi:hypothetical protein